MLKIFILRRLYNIMDNSNNNNNNHNNDTNKVALSSEVIKGLIYLCNEMTLEEAKKIIENSVQIILHQEMPELYRDINSNIIKHSEYSVITLYALATRYEFDNLELRHLLEEYKISQIMIEELIHAYDGHRDEFVLRQLCIAKYLPIITDVQWRILANIKSSSLLLSPSNDSTDEVHFSVNLGKCAQKNGERKTVAEFVCNTEEMQHLINKLKEIERHCNKITSG